MKIMQRYGPHILFAVSLFNASNSMSQCPPNLGFESGEFQNWACSAGLVDQNGVVHMITNTQINNRHTIIDKNGNTMDPYGHFSLQSPNGSRYCIRLGNNSAGAEAERISYTFTVPSDKNDYTIIYDYAVVFQDPGHFAFQQPRFNAKVFDVVTDQYISCASQDFIASSALPGFALSDIASNGSYDVYYKPWALASIKISGYAGKTVRLEFTTNDCIGGDHFGYAYIDVNDACNTAITGNVYCQGISAIKLSAPFGFEKYYWYDSNFTSLLDSSGTLTIKPPPPAGSEYAVIVKPYPGVGCLDTLFTTITYTTIPFKLKVVDSANFCLPAIGNLTASWITAGSSAGLTYSYFRDSLLTQYLPKPDSIIHNGVYYINGSNSNGCTDNKPVKISINISPKLSIADPPVSYYPLGADLTASSVFASDISGLLISYWQNASATVPLSNPGVVTTPGVYYIKATNGYGCPDIKAVNVVISIQSPPNIFTPNADGINDKWEIPGLSKYPQCKVEIFNRWGQLIFHSVGYNTPWDGKLHGKNVPAGAYYYIIEIGQVLKPMCGFIGVLR